MGYVNNIHTMEVTRSLAMSAEPVQGAMICVRGDTIGKMITLQNDRRIVVGRDPVVCNLVLSDLKVSRKHLEITYLGTINKYRVVDYSSNGTFLRNGCRLKKNQEYYLEPMTELRLGSEKVVYKLR